MMMNPVCVEPVYTLELDLKAAADVAAYLDRHKVRSEGQMAAS